MGYVSKTFQYSRVEPQDDRTIFESLLKYCSEEGGGSGIDNISSVVIDDISYTTSGLDFILKPCKLFIKGGYIIIDTDEAITLPPSKTSKVICRIDTTINNNPKLETRTDSNSDTFNVIVDTLIDNQVVFTSTVLELTKEDINSIQGIYEEAIYTVTTNDTGITNVVRNIKLAKNIVTSKVTNAKLTDGTIVVKEATNSDKLDNKHASDFVQLTGNQTVAGIKTFSSPPVSATNPTTSNQVANKAYVDALGSQVTTLDGANVKLTGNQSIAGIKTFSSPPVSATNPTASNQVANKAYVDSAIASTGGNGMKVQSGIINNTTATLIDSSFSGLNTNRYIDITISAVDITKAYVQINCGQISGGSQFSGIQSARLLTPIARLINSTTLRIYATVYETGTQYYVQGVHWQVIYE